MSNIRTPSSISVVFAALDFVGATRTGRLPNGSTAIVYSGRKLDIYITERTKAITITPASVELKQALSIALPDWIITNAGDTKGRGFHA